MVGFAMVLGGAAKGLGEGIVEKAKAQREMMMKMLEEETHDRRLSEEREFRSSEAEKDRQFRMEEGQKDRDSKVEYSMDSEGNTVAIRGDKGTVVKDEAGKPVKGVGGDKFEVDRKYRMLIAGGMDPKKAALIAAGEKTPSAMDIEKMVEDAVENDTKGSLTGSDPAKNEELRAKHRERLMKVFGVESTDAAEPQAPPAPRDPAKREVGKVYMAPDGRRIEWTGEGWKVVTK